MPDRLQSICQIECQNRRLNRCQIHWWIKCQNVCPNICLAMSWWGSLEVKQFVPQLKEIDSLLKQLGDHYMGYQQLYSNNGI